MYWQVQAMPWAEHGQRAEERRVAAAIAMPVNEDSTECTAVVAARDCRLSGLGCSTAVPACNADSKDSTWYLRIEAN